MDRLAVHPGPIDPYLQEPPLDPRLVELVTEAAVLSDMCEEFHALPRAGGMLNQPAGLMRRMLILRRYRKAVQMVEDPNLENVPDSVSALVSAGVDTRINRAILYTQALREEAARAEAAQEYDAWRDERRAHKLAAN